MIVIAVVRSHRLPQLKEAIANLNKTQSPPWAIFELERDDIAGIPISRIALLCDSLPLDGYEIAIEGVIQEGRYCPTCLEQGKFNALPPHNKSGWCAKHQDKNPERTKRKRKKQI